MGAQAGRGASAEPRLRIVRMGAAYAVVRPDGTTAATCATRREARQARDRVEAAERPAEPVDAGEGAARIKAAWEGR